MLERFQDEEQARQHLVNDTARMLEQAELHADQLASLPGVQDYVDIWLGAPGLPGARLTHEVKGSWTQMFAWHERPLLERVRIMTAYQYGILMQASSVIAGAEIGRRNKAGAVQEISFDQGNEAIGHLFKQGFPKVIQRIRGQVEEAPYGEGHELITQEEATIEQLIGDLPALGLTRATLAEVDLLRGAMPPGTEDPARYVHDGIDERLQAACQQIIENPRAKIIPSESSTSAQLSAHIMNALRTSYHSAPDAIERLRAKLFPLYTIGRSSPLLSSGIGYQTDLMRDTIRREFDTAASDIADFTTVAPAWTDKERALARAYDTMAAATENVGSWIKDANRAFGELIFYRNTRMLVDRIADGTIKFSEVIQLAQLQRAPLAFMQREPSERETRVRQVTWEPLRRGPRRAPGEPRPPREPAEGESEEAAFDQDRIDWLEDLGYMWDETGESWFIAERQMEEARTTRRRKTADPDKPARKYRGYYVLVMQQRIGDKIISHAVADSGDVGHKAVYVFRGELEEEIGGTWEDVYDGGRPRARALGAVQVWHQGDYQSAILDRLTVPITSLKRPPTLGIIATEATFAS